MEKGNEMEGKRAKDVKKYGKKKERGNEMEGKGKEKK